MHNICIARSAIFFFFSCCCVKPSLSFSPFLLLASVRATGAPSDSCSSTGTTLFYSLILCCASLSLSLSLLLALSSALLNFKRKNPHPVHMWWWGPVVCLWILNGVEGKTSRSELILGLWPNLRSVIFLMSVWSVGRGRLFCNPGGKMKVKPLTFQGISVCSLSLTKWKYL